jgi:hypothetical protein
VLDIHLFGDLRKYSDAKKMTDDSVVMFDFLENEKIDDMILRMGITLEEIGEVFVNHTVVTLDTIIESDESRIAIFSSGMRLLCGGQHLKGHGWIQKDAPEVDYY